MVVHYVDKTELLNMLDEIRLQHVVSVPNSVIIHGLQDSRFEVRNIAAILAKRRGLQVVEVNHDV